MTPLSASYAFVPAPAATGGVVSWFHIGFTHENGEAVSYRVRFVERDVGKSSESWSVYRSEEGHEMHFDETGENMHVFAPLGSCHMYSIDFMHEIPDVD